MTLPKNKISVIIPFYNEENTLNSVFNNLVKLSFIDQIILVNDGSTDDSLNIAKEISEKHSFVDLVSTSRNLGKGEAVKQGLFHSRYSNIGIFDADLEYSAEDLMLLYEEFKFKNLDLILGSRFIGNKKRKNIYLRTYFANKFLSYFFSLVNKNKITDIATCLKIFKKELLINETLKMRDFSIEIELVSKILKKTNNYLELPISYEGRTYSQGKKIKFIDGFKYINAIIKFR